MTIKNCQPHDWGMSGLFQIFNIKISTPRQQKLRSNLVYYNIRPFLTHERSCDFCFLTHFQFTGLRFLSLQTIHLDAIPTMKLTEIVLNALGHFYGIHQFTFFGIAHQAIKLIRLFLLLDLLYYSRDTLEHLVQNKLARLPLFYSALVHQNHWIEQAHFGTLLNPRLVRPSRGLRALFYTSGYTRPISLYRAPVHVSASHNLLLLLLTLDRLNRT